MRCWVGGGIDFFCNKWGVDVFVRFRESDFCRLLARYIITGRF